MRLCAELAVDLDGSFEALVVAFQDRLYGFALRVTGSPRDAEEVAQDAFVRAYHALQGYSAERIRSLALKAWLYRITLNVSRNRLRSRGPATVPLDPPDGDPPLDLPDEGTETPEEGLERGEDGRLLARLIAALPPRYREAVVLRWVEGLPYAEMAGVLSQPVGTVKANVHRGIGLLRTALAEQEPAAWDEWRYTYGRGKTRSGRARVGAAAFERSSRPG